MSRNPRKTALAGRRTPILISILALALSNAAGAEQWSVVGARYQGMGGAGVATVNDGLAGYWNPGALAFTESYDVNLPLSGQVSIEGDVIGDLEDIADLASDNGVEDILDKIGNGEALTAGEEGDIQKALELADKIANLADESEGFVGSVSTGLTVRYNRFSISASGISYFGAQAITDLESLALSAINGNPTDAQAAAALDAALGDLTRSAGGRTLTGSDAALADEITATITDSRPGLDAALPGFTTEDAVEELVYQSSQAGLDSSNSASSDLITTIATSTAGLDGDGNVLADPSTLKDADNGAKIRGAAIASANFGYGHPLNVPIPLPGISEGVVGIGGNLKVMHGTTYEQFVRYDDTKDLLDKLLDRENTKDSWDWGLDLGMLYKPVDWMALGLTARNVNTPSFDYKDGGQYELEPQVRAGLAVNIFPSWVVAMDFDLTENETDNLNGYKSQVAALGTEFAFPLGPVGLALRGGLSVDHASEKDSLVPSAGIAFKFWHLQLEAAGSYSVDTEEVDDEDVPNRFSAAVGLKFAKTF